MSLQSGNHKRGTELLVLDDRALRDPANFVENPIRQFDGTVTDCQPTIRIIDDGDPLAVHHLGLFARLQDEDDLVLLQGQRLFRVRSFFTGKGVVEIIRRRVAADANRCCWPAPWQRKPDDLAVNEVGCGRISLQCASMRRKIALDGPGIRGNVGLNALRGTLAKARNSEGAIACCSRL
jgi:hypothetical protein